MNIVDRISSDLQLDTTYINNIISRSEYYYKDYRIPKRNGDTRLISQAGPELKTLQYWVLDNILNKLPVSQSAFAYKKGDSIKKHANFHSMSNFMLHTDIRDFFHSIHFNHLSPILKENEEIFVNLELDISESLDIIKKICFRNDFLCIGTVSSPAISNIIMYSFDLKLMGYCKLNKYKYSRYADDIYLSSKNYIDANAIEYISSQLNNYNLKINRSKTRFFSSKYRRKITGLIITNEHKISIGIDRRKQIKKLIYDKLINKKGDSEQILGYLAFLKDIEPNTYNKLIIKYSSYCDEDIISVLST